jgi:hypothetical protein
MKPKYRIGGIQKTIMISFALLFDFIEFILAIFAIGLILNRIITVLEYFIYIIWFALNRVIFTKPKNIARLGGTFTFEMIPVVGALPLFTLGVYMTIKQSQKEDLEKFNEEKSAEEEKIISKQSKEGKIIRMKQQIKQDRFNRAA